MEQDDPAAAFLAREQDELAGVLDEDTLGYTTTAVSVWRLRGQFQNSLSHLFLYSQSQSLSLLHLQIS